MIKRTKDIKHEKFRKKHHLFRIAPIALAVNSMLMLSGCGKEQIIHAKVYKNERQCIAENPNLADVCKTTYKNALIEAQKTAPKYSTRRDCEEEFGTNSCRHVTNYIPIKTNNNRYRGFEWMPSMNGYLMPVSNKKPLGYTPIFTSTAQNSPAYGKFVDAAGRSYGKNIFNQTIKVDRSVFTPKPETTSTIKRGGFGELVKRMAANPNFDDKTDSITSKKNNRLYNRSSRSSYRSYGG